MDYEDFIMKSFLGLSVATAGVGAFFGYRYFFPKGKLSFNGRKWTITDEDQLWAGRMLIGEVSEQPSNWANPSYQEAGAAVLWSVATRWVSLSQFQSMSFTQLMRAFSQPINPRWAVAGQGLCVGRESACSDYKIQRRARIASKAWSELPEQVREIVTRFTKGRLENPVPGYNNFAAASAISQSKIAASELPARTLGGNTFIRDPGSIPGEVRVV